MYEIVEKKIARNITNSVGQRTALSLVHIVCDTASDMPEPLPHWISGSRCDVLENGGSVYLLSSQRTWTNVIFYNQGGEGDGFDPDAYYTKQQTDAKITEKVAEIVADAPEDFDTLKEMSDWIDSHEDSAAAMNSAIQANATAITSKVDKVAGKGLSTNDYTTTEKNKLDGIEAGADKTVIDFALNSSSTNPVQNKVIKEVLDNKVDKVSGKGLSTEDYTTAEKTKLADLENYDDTQIYEAINSLGRSIGTVGQAVEGKVDKITGKGLSTEDYTTEEKNKLSGIASGAEVNVQSDWNQTNSSADDFIKNKPAIPTVDQTFDATSPNAQSGVAIASVLGGGSKFDYLYHGVFNSEGRQDIELAHSYEDYDIVFIRITEAMTVTRSDIFLVEQDGYFMSILETTDGGKCAASCGSIGTFVNVMKQSTSSFRVDIAGIKI